MTLLKILVFSDSHRYTGGMIQAIEEQQPDLVVHLGDLQRDAEELALLYPKLSMVTVPGNCDGWTTDPLERQFMVCGKRVLLSHGPIWHVKQGYDAASRSRTASGSSIQAAPAAPSASSSQRGRLSPVPCWTCPDGRLCKKNTPGTCSRSRGCFFICLSPGQRPPQWPPPPPAWLPECGPAAGPAPSPAAPPPGRSRPGSSLRRISCP